MLIDYALMMLPFSIRQKLAIWLLAMRPPTLSLSVASVGLGNVLAYQSGVFSGSLAALGLMTAIFLQILANFANDYGDAVRHTDAQRLASAPKRMVSAGLISPQQMKIAMVVMIFFCIISGLSLIIQAAVSLWLWIIFGLSAIISAIAYTVGKKTYGYKGLGDLFVFIFFGQMAVVGMFFLQTHTLNLPIFLPATALGLWSVSVLNINNIRDLNTDNKSGKNTVAVRLGDKNARHYHTVLISTALILWSIYTISYQYYWAMIVPMLFSVFHIKTIYHIDNTKLFNIELAKLSLAVLLFVAVLWLSNFKTI